jgi:type I restriction-modification system DNA methylase subunit
MDALPNRAIDVKTAFNEIQPVLATFHMYRDRYRQPGYSESALRDDFIRPLLLALGWDVEHRLQQDPLRQEVKVEQNVHLSNIGEGKKKADYAFFTEPNFRRGDERFFMEVKKPSISLAHPKNYFQAVRYGWSVQNPVTVLTNFDELHVLDCRYAPNIDTIIECRIPDYVFRYTDLQNEEKFAQLFYLLSRDAVAGGSLERLAGALPSRRGKAVQRGLFAGAYQRVDETFLAQLLDYRANLARSLKLTNPWLDSDALTEITQRILDRLIFLRFLEDKLIETRDKVGDFGNSGSVWGDFVAASRRLDSVYNGIVFKSHDLVDTGRLVVDEHMFGDICEDLSSENTPYDFNSIPIHILGSIYEGFLGTVIAASDTTAKLEDKPEVRKAGGVFYTPEYVVRYVVDQTVGNIVAGRTPAQINELRFADISCGSGSFLLGIFDALLIQQTRWYNDNPTKAPPQDALEEESGSLRISLKRKREILVQCIYGVDIDHQAVEVAQLSLYLKLLEDENTSTARFFQRELHETLLPTLNRNIVSGNSLVGPDILATRTFSDAEEQALNPMNFKDRFASIMKSGGFHAILGNPPWGATITCPEYLRDRYERVVTRMPDTYIYFIDQAIRLLRPEGVMGYVVPGTVLNQVDATAVRRLMLEHGVRQVIALGERVFGPKVLNTAAILVTGKCAKTAPIILGDLSAYEPDNRAPRLSALTPTVRKKWLSLVETDAHSTFFASAAGAEQLLARMRKKYPMLDDSLVYGIQRGVTPDVAAAHVLTREEQERAQIEDDLLFPSVSGPQLRRYGTWTSDQYIIYTTRDTEIDNYPRAKAYLAKFFRSKEKKCPEVRDGKHPWYSLHRPRNPAIFESPKFIGLTTSKMIEVIYDAEDNLIVTDAMYVFQTKRGLDPWAVMAVLHSSTLLYLYRVSNQGEARVIPQVKASKLGMLPFPDLTKKKALQKSLSADCKALIEVKQKSITATLERQKSYYEQRLAELNAKIDTAVFELYELTDDETALIENIPVPA